MVMRSFGAVLCLALVASACSSGADLSAPTVVLDSTTTSAAAPTTTAASTTTEAPTTTLSPEQEAEAELRELAMAYLTYENNEFEEGRTEPWPILELTTGRLLDRVAGVRQNDLENGYFVVGSLLNPVLVSVEVSGDVGRIDLCTDDDSYRVDTAGAGVGPRWKGGARLGYLSAVLVEQKWLLEEFTLKEEVCDPADYS